METIFVGLGVVVVILVIVLAVVLRRPNTTVDLGQASEQLVMLAKQQLELATQAGAAALDTKKELIDQQVKGVKDELEKVTKLVTDIEKERGGKLSQWATEASEQLIKLAEARLRTETRAGSDDMDKKKQLIDQQVKAVKEKLEKVTDLIRDIEKERAGKFSELTTQITTLGDQTSALTKATSTLGEALRNPQARGQWGERIADDILRFAGFIEGVNYLRQSANGAGSRPDYVFLLPNEQRLNMDSKFPLNNYLKVLEATSDNERRTYERAFLRDVRSKIKEISGRDYIDPEGGTLDFVLLFIPNDSIYAYIHQTDASMLDAALRNQVVCCSPLTLFAVLAIIRQAMDSFALHKASDEILSHFGRFKMEWQKFTKALETLGARLISAQKAYDEVAGPRKRQLERPLSHMEDIRQQRGLGVAPAPLDSEPFAPPEAEGPEGDEEEASSEDRAQCLSIA